MDRSWVEQEAGLSEVPMTLLGWVWQEDWKQKVLWDLEHLVRLCRRPIVDEVVSKHESGVAALFHSSDLSQTAQV